MGMTKRLLGKVLYFLIILLLAGVFLYCAWQLYAYFSESKETQGAYDALSEIVQQARPTEDPQAPTFDWSELETLPDAEIEELPVSPYVSVQDPKTGKEIFLLPEFAELYSINPDIVGWISIPDTNVNYPVVQRKEQTDYYLYRDFHGKQVARGCIYVREQCDVFAPSDNVVIYGHMMKDSTMFADLANYTNKKYWEEHQSIRFDTLRGRYEYQIICVFKTTATVGEGFPYHQFVDAQYDSDLDEFWYHCQKNALYDTGLAPRYGDKLITLSTCEYSRTNGRLVIVAKRMD